MDFSDYQRWFLNTICGYFHDHAQWPTYGWLDRTLRKQHDDLDVQDVGNQLEDFMYDGLHTPILAVWDPKRESYLSISALYACQTEGIFPALAEDFDAFLQVLRFCIERWEADEDTPRVEASDVREPFGMSDMMLRKVFELMRLSGLTGGAGHGENPANWYVTVSSEIRAYRNVKTLGDFFQVRQKERDKYTRMRPAAFPQLPSVSGRPSSTVPQVPDADSADRNSRAPVTPAVFISYRRDDSAGHAGRLNEDLVSHFGQNAVFFDLGSIDPGMDFVNVIENTVASCRVLLAIMGKSWLTITDLGDTRRRLDNPDDFVRLEIATALRRGITVVPVLVHGAHMPKGNDLPADLAQLARHQAHEITDSRWEYDVGKLVEAITKAIDAAPGHLVQEETQISSIDSRPSAVANGGTLINESNAQPLLVQIGRPVEGTDGQPLSLEQAVDASPIHTALLRLEANPADPRRTNPQPRVIAVTQEPRGTWWVYEWRLGEGSYQGWPMADFRDAEAYCAYRLDTPRAPIWFPASGWPAVQGESGLYSPPISIFHASQS